MQIAPFYFLCTLPECVYVHAVIKFCHQIHEYKYETCNLRFIIYKNMVNPMRNIKYSAKIAVRLLLIPQNWILNQIGLASQVADSLSITLISLVRFCISTSNTQARDFKDSKLALFPDSTYWIVRVLYPLIIASCSWAQFFFYHGFFKIIFAYIRLWT